MTGSAPRPFSVASKNVLLQDSKHLLLKLEDFREVPPEENETSHFLLTKLKILPRPAFLLLSQSKVCKRTEVMSGTRN